MLVVTGRLNERLIVDPLVQLGTTRSHDGRDAGRRRRIGGVTNLEVARHLHPGGILMRDGDRTKASIVGGEVYDAPVGDRRGDVSRKAAKGLLVVERPVEDLVGARQEGEPLGFSSRIASLSLLAVDHDDDHAAGGREGEDGEDVGRLEPGAPEPRKDREVEQDHRQGHLDQARHAAGGDGHDHDREEEGKRGKRLDEGSRDEGGRRGGPDDPDRRVQDRPGSGAALLPGAAACEGAHCL
jgi:hypothetical protein